MSATSSVVSGIRPISKVINGRSLMEGAGVRIFRTIGVSESQRVDPFLMLDELKLPAKEASAGFTMHPHRGMETIGPGGVQWMTAGRGIIHSEMPVVTSGDLHGFQLWMNLPAKKKMCKPRYQDVQADQIPVASVPGASVRVMAGSVGSEVGPMKLRNPGMLLDVRVEAGQEWQHKVPSEWNSFAYVYEGAGKLSGHVAEMQHSYVFGNDGDTVVGTAGAKGLKFLLFAGKPLNEPVAQMGPFVMNHPLELQQAVSDYHSGKFQNPDDNPWVDDDDDDEDV